MARPKIKSDGRSITVRVPISIRKRGGKKVVLAPDGGLIETQRLFCPQVDNAMVKAIARGCRWRDMLEQGKYSTIAEIAAAEQINESYIGRVLRLSLLAPDVVEEILGGHQSAEMTLAALMRSFPMDWRKQREQFASRV
jgi:hypothetical protein